MAKVIRSADPVLFTRMYVKYGTFTFTGAFNGRKTKVIEYRDVRLSLSSVNKDWYHGEWTHTWSITYKAGRKREQIGHFNVSYRKNIATISYSNINEQFRGFGLGKMIYSTLAHLYQVLESDPNGNTSDEARGVWRSLKAKRVNGKRFRLKGQRKIPFEVIDRCQTRK